MAYLVRDISAVLGDGLRPDGIHFGDELVQLGIGVVPRLPDCLAVCWVGAAGVVLFLAGVDDWDTVCHDGECGGVFGERHVFGVSGLRQYVLVE